MRMPALRIACTSTALCLLLTFAASAEVILEARQWAADPSGQIRVDGSGAADTIDLTRDLGLEEDESLDGRLLIRPSRRTSVRFGWAPITLTGEQVVSRTISFMGSDFDISTRVVSDLEIDYGRLGFAWQFLSSRDGRFRFGPLVEAKGLRGTAILSAPDIPSPISESEEFEVAFASAGVALDLEPNERFHVFAEATVLVDDSEGDLDDIEAGVRFYATKTLAIVAGVKSLEIDATDDDDMLQMDLEGAFAGLSVRF